MSFNYGGINHLALVCEDMDVTVKFYSEVLGMKLTKTINLPDGRGKHFFFDAGGDDAIAFFWFPDGPAKVDKRALQKISATPGTMNHVAFDVSPDDIDRYRELLIEKGVEVTEIVNHDDTQEGASPELNESTFVRSLYFRDPDGIQLEFAAWTRPLTEADVQL
jgi:catechol 2,3-dioxygenase-like lactoylglutathione lyase family enzyme